MLNTIFEEFVSDPERHRAYEREALALQASELIFGLMEREGMSKAELAERIGKSRSAITQVLSGSRNMTVHTLADLACVLGHKVELSATPFATRQALKQYVLQSCDQQQEQFFGSYCVIPRDEQDDEDIDEELPNAA